MAIADSLVAWYDLDEASGATRRDATGRGNDLTSTGTVGQATGIIGNAALFNKSASQYLNHASNTDFAMGDIDFTITAWVYITDNTVYSYIVTKDDDGALSATRNYNLYITPDAGARATWYVFDTTFAARGVEDGVFSANAWHFIYASYQASLKQLAISTDNGTVLNAGTVNGLQADGGVQFCVGNSFNAIDPSTAGRIDAVGVWKRLLTATEITWLYNSGAGRSSRDVIFPYIPRLTDRRRNLRYVRN